MTQPDFPLIDPHIHLWDPKNTPKLVSPLVKTLGWSPWLLNQVSRLLMPKPIMDFVGPGDFVLTAHLPDIYRKDAGKYKIGGYVHIQAGWEDKAPNAASGELIWIETLKDKPLAIVGEAHLSDWHHLDQLLDAHMAASPRFRGVRDMVAAYPSSKIHNWHANPNLMQTDAFRKGYQRLGERGLTFDTFLYSNQLEDFTKLTKDINSTKVVLDHVGTPVGVAGHFGGVGATTFERDVIKNEWYDGLNRVSQNEQVYIKLSGLFMPICGNGFHLHKEAVSLSQVVDAIAPHIEFAINTFGVDRCMFASNFPMDKVSLSYEMLYDAYFEIVQDYSSEDQKKLFCTNALDFYGVKIS